MVAARISLTGSARKNAEHRVRQQVRQNEDERDQQNDLAQTGQQQADLGLSQRHKALLAGDLEAHGKDTGHVDCAWTMWCSRSAPLSEVKMPATAPGASIMSSQNRQV